MPGQTCLGSGCIPPYRQNVATIARAWRELPQAHRRWVFINALAVTAVINLVMNGGIAWLSAHGITTVPLRPGHGLMRPNVLTDTIGTFVLLPYITSLLCTTAIWQQRRRGLLPSAPNAGWARPSTRSRRGLLLAACTLPLLAVLIGVLVAVAPDGLDRTQFALYKAALGVALGALVTPVIAIWALTDAMPVDVTTEMEPRGASAKRP